MAVLNLTPDTTVGSDLLDKNAKVFLQLTHGEQRRTTFELDWLTSLVGYTLSAQLVEGGNASDDGAVVPGSEATTPVVTTLPILDADATDNTFQVVFPKNMLTSWSVKPTVIDPVYGFFSLSVADAGVGDEQQVFVVRGLVEILYNPLETS